MKKLIVGVLMCLLFMGCASVNQQTAVNASIDIAYVAALQNNPKAIPDVVKYLGTVKEYISCTECNIEDLKLQAINLAPDKYKLYALILSDYIDDVAIANFLDDKINADSKDKITKKIDRLIKISGLIECGGDCPLE